MVRTCHGQPSVQRLASVYSRSEGQRRGRGRACRHPPRDISRRGHSNDASFGLLVSVPIVPSHSKMPINDLAGSAKREHYIRLAEVWTHPSQRFVFVPGVDPSTFVPPVRSQTPPTSDQVEWTRSPVPSPPPGQLEHRQDFCPLPEMPSSSVKHRPSLLEGEFARLPVPSCKAVLVVELGADRHPQFRGSTRSFRPAQTF
jgi:hypothetical protein